MWGNECLSGIKELQFGEHRFRQNPKWCPDKRVKSRVFMKKKRKGMITWDEEEHSHWCWQSGLLLCTHDWGLIRSLDRRPMTLGPIIRMSAFLLTSQTTVQPLCLGYNCSMTMPHSAIPLEGLLSLHFKIAQFMSFFTSSRTQFLFSQPRYDDGIYWFWWVTKDFTMFPRSRESGALIEWWAVKAYYLSSTPASSTYYLYDIRPITYLFASVAVCKMEKLMIFTS